MSLMMSVDVRIDYLHSMRYISFRDATRVSENPGNPPVFKPVNAGLCAGENPGLTGLISGVSTHRMLIIQLVYSYLQSTTSVFGKSGAPFFPLHDTLYKDSFTLQ